VPKVKPVPEQAEASEKKLGRGRKNKIDPETEENEGVSKVEGVGEATAGVSKRGQALKKTETEKLMDTGTEAEDSQRKGAIQATKKAADLVEEGGEKEEKRSLTKVWRVKIQNLLLKVSRSIQKMAELVLKFNEL
jgi:hypothetical protein